MFQVMVLGRAGWEYSDMAGDSLKPMGSFQHKCSANVLILGS